MSVYVLEIIENFHVWDGTIYYDYLFCWPTSFLLPPPLRVVDVVDV